MENSVKIKSEPIEEFNECDDNENGIPGISLEEFPKCSPMCAPGITVIKEEHSEDEETNGSIPPGITVIKYEFNKDEESFPAKRIKISPATFNVGILENEIPEESETFSNVPSCSNVSEKTADTNSLPIIFKKSKDSMILYKLTKPNNLTCFVDDMSKQQKEINKSTNESLSDILEKSVSSKLKIRKHAINPPSKSVVLPVSSENNSASSSSARIRVVVNDLEETDPKRKKAYAFLMPRFQKNQDGAVDVQDVSDVSKKKFAFEKSMVSFASSFVEKSIVRSKKRCSKRLNVEICEQKSRFQKNQDGAVDVQDESDVSKKKFAFEKSMVSLASTFVEKSIDRSKKRSCKRLTVEICEQKSPGICNDRDAQNTYAKFCSICKSKVSRTQFHDHAIWHVANLDWLFKCLLCENTFKYKDHFRLHMLDAHKLRFYELLPGVHFEDVEVQHQSAIDDIKEKAFDYDSKKHRRRLCKICNIYVSDKVETIKKHMDKHLPDVGVDWLFKCLICDDFQCIVIGDIRHHLLHVHQVEYNAKDSNDQCVDRRLELVAKFYDVRCLAFPDTIRTKKIYQPKTSRRKRPESLRKDMTCEVCGLVLKSVNSVKMLYKHCVVHITDLFGVEWICECLICGFKTLHLNSMKTHLLLKHKIKRGSGKEGLHYANFLSQYQQQLDETFSKSFPQLWEFLQSS